MATPSAESRRYGIDEYAQLHEPDDVRTELVRGFLVREPQPGPVHGSVQARITSLLDRHLREGDLGMVFTEVGVVVEEDPPTVRGPDVAVLLKDRVPRPLGGRFLRTAPDLCVEVVSPGNSASNLQDKVIQYLEAGVGCVWVVDPAPRTVTVYRSRRDIRVLRHGETLEGGDAVPGFQVPLGELWPPELE